jgi:hypothetical protein
MAYDENLARRVRELLAHLAGYAERPWPGGLRFTLSRRTCCGIVGADLIVRVGDDEHADALGRPHARAFGTRRAGRRLVAVAPAGWRTSRALALWVSRGVEAVLAARADEQSRRSLRPTRRPTRRDLRRE